MCHDPEYERRLSAIGEVVRNRPEPLRKFDQIYMNEPDMVYQVCALSHWLQDRNVLFVGDGDGIGLALTHCSRRGLVANGPKHVTVLDFDERVVNSINGFASRLSYNQAIRAERYNVVDPLPKQHWSMFNAFYTNPPWGASNGGASVRAFVQRAIEAMGGLARGCIVIGDSPEHEWTYAVQLSVQRQLLAASFRIAAMAPRLHKYALDDDPDLTSCLIHCERTDDPGVLSYKSAALPEGTLRDFYGTAKDLNTQYVKDVPGRCPELVPLGQGGTVE
ncbi:putative methyltransferase [Candidatus Poribacteria bacterium]|nr:putative methyltransferase [Candidatus Poribacteria bacterium]